MKKIIITFIAITSLSLTTKAQQEINIDIEKSVANWKGSMLFGFGEHKGTTKFEEGKVILTNNAITGGSFVIDMNSITGTDNGKIDTDSGLIKHLKDPDFFDVQKYPMASLVITNIKYHNDQKTLTIKSDLTIKGITLPVEYEGKIDTDKKMMMAKLVIDRTQWKISYGSRAVTNIKNNIISDAIKFEVMLHWN